MFKLYTYNPHIYDEHKPCLVKWDLTFFISLCILLALSWYFDINLHEKILLIVGDIITLFSILIGFSFTGYFSALSGQIGNRLYKYQDKIFFKNKKEVVTALQRVTYYLNTFFIHSITLIVILLMLKLLPNNDIFSQYKIFILTISCITIVLFFRTIVFFVLTYRIAFMLLLNNRNDEDKYLKEQVLETCHEVKKFVEKYKRNTNQN